MDPQATAGRIVHYTDATERATAAIVCVDAAPDGLASLLTFFPGKQPTPMRSVPYSEQPTAGCWSWMPYQKKKAEIPGGNISESAEPRPARGTLDDIAAHLNDLNERLENLELGELADPANAVPARAEPPNADAEPDQVAAGETSVVTEPGPAAPAAADGQDSGPDEAQEASPDDAAR